MYTDFPPAIMPALIILVLFTTAMLSTLTIAVIKMVMIKADQNKLAYRHNRR